MERNAPWITCRMGKKVYLLARDEKAYYLIEVGKNLDYATEEWLESQGVSEALLKNYSCLLRIFHERSCLVLVIPAASPAMRCV